MRASKLLGAAAAAVALLASAGAVAKEELPTSNPWRDSEIDYEHGFSAISLNKGAEPTYNPYYAHRLTIWPHWHFGDYALVRARLIIEQQITNADDTTYKNEVVLSDLLLDANWKGITEPYSGIKLKSGVRFTLPTSKGAQAETLRMGIGPSVGLDRKFPLLGGLTLGYASRFTFYFHGKQVAETESVYRPCGGDYSNPSGCGPEMAGGTRNAWFGILHGPSLIFVPHERVTVDASYSFIKSYLYDLAGGTYLGDDQDVAVRSSQWFLAAVTVEVVDFLSVSVGASTLFGDLKPNGKYRTPFFNRTTELSLSLNLAIDPLLSKFL